MTVPTLAALEATDDWTRYRVADLRADVADGAAGLTAETIAADILDIHMDGFTRDDVWDLIDQAADRGTYWQPTE